MPQKRLHLLAVPMGARVTMGLSRAEPALQHEARAGLTPSLGGSFLQAPPKGHPETRLSTCFLRTRTSRLLTVGPPPQGSRGARRPAPAVKNVWQP